MSGWKFKYPHIPLLLSVRPTPRILLGKRLHWTMKEDGECVSVWENQNVYNKKKFIQISSRNLLEAKSDIVSRTQGSEDYPKVLNLLEQHPQFICYVEECQKGRCVTGVKTYDRAYLFLFDIYDRSAKRFLPYVAVHQHGFHHKIPVVKLYAETRHRSMKDLLKFKNHVLEHCHAVKEEGMVIKTWDKILGYVQAKVKIDVPEPKRRKISRGEPILPPIPDNEIFGAISKVLQDIGNVEFMKVEVAMPMIAKYVGEECQKHLYSKPQKKLFQLYQEFMERMLS